MGNPFQEESAALLVLDTKSIADSALVELVGTHHEPGKQFKSFKEDYAISIRMKYLDAVALMRKQIPECLYIPWMQLWTVKGPSTSKQMTLMLL